MKQGIFRSGTSGLVLSEPNKTHFPKEFREKPRLVYYASKYNSIEVNSSFYKIPRCQTYRNWSAEVPEDFQFSIKLWKGITHNRSFGFEFQDLVSFFSALDCLGKKKGCLLIQFPAGSTMELAQFGQLLEQLKKMDPDNHWRLAIEFRHPRWYKKQAMQIMKLYDASLVLHDMPNSFVDKLQGTPSFVYLRFHGEKGDYRGTYSDDFLQIKAREIKQWMAQGLDVYAYFNNTIGAASDNVQTLNKLVTSI